MPAFWDYLVVTASNARQASAYETQLRFRRETGLLERARTTLVIPDTGGRRIGSGGSTLACLRRLAEIEGAAVRDVVARRRILTLHAGGDSRRLPAYGPCGKIFVPLPGDSGGALPLALFDELAPRLMDLASAEVGQVLVAAGDALLLFDASSVAFDASGLMALGAYATPEESARHGVFCLEDSGKVRLYLQKPSLEEQARQGAISCGGRSLLDIGVMSLDAQGAAALDAAFDPSLDAVVLQHGVDLYREICCAMGSEATFEHYLSSARGSGCHWPESNLRSLFPRLREIPLYARVVPHCAFLHFGSTRELAASGRAYALKQPGAAPEMVSLSRQNSFSGDGRVNGDGWVEGCHVAAPLTLMGDNVVTGAEIVEPLTLPRGACLDVVEGVDRQGQHVWFVRPYHIDDSFKDASFMGRPIADNLWESRVAIAERSAHGWSKWLWMFDPDAATGAQQREFEQADKYSAAEIALAADQDRFHERRAAIRAAVLARSPGRWFTRDSRFSAADLRFALARMPDREQFVTDLMAALREREPVDTPSLDDFLYCRMAHTLGSALEDDRAAELCDLAFRTLNQTVLRSSLRRAAKPRKALRPDETIWGRGPARIELGGGWTDTPPYTLEYGGDVANVAVNLNGQPPIHCYCRIVEEPVIRLASIDGGERIDIRTREELLDYRRPEDRFALAKAALAISGFSPEMLGEFGGGIELTTLVGIPKGSGLGTSSILGAVLMAVINRLLGRPLDQREIFHDVLRLEQALTTGGGWQDQIGGGTPGAKITSTRPGMFPDPRVHYVPADLICPRSNGGSTLLYYTGLTRLAKNILNTIVGKYFNRDRAVMQALAEEHEVARMVADSLSRKDAAAFGAAVNYAWELQKRLCGFVTNPEIERLLARVRPHVHGMRISGAGSGGFLFMICRSPQDATLIREMLEREPLNERSRFFDFEVNQTGIEVTTC